MRVLDVVGELVTKLFLVNLLHESSSKSFDFFGVPGRVGSKPATGSASIEAEQPEERLLVDAQARRARGLSPKVVDCAPCPAFGEIQTPSRRGG